jgi:hypothetical protein
VTAGVVVWWRDEGRVRQRVERVVGRRLPDGLWVRVWQDYVEDFIAVDDQEQAESIIEQLIERVEETRELAREWYGVPVPVPVRRRRRTGEPEPVRWDDRRMQAQLERNLWHLEHDPAVQQVRAMLGHGQLSLEEARSVLESPVLAWTAVSEWERLGIPPVHRVRLERRDAHESVCAVTWTGGSRLITLPAVAAEQLETFGEKVWFPLRPDGTEQVPLTLRPARRDSPLGALYRAAHKVERFAFLPRGLALAWILSSVSLVAERLVWANAHLEVWHPPTATAPVVSLQVTLRLLAGLPEAYVTEAYQAFERWLHTEAPYYQVEKPTARRVSDRTVALACFWHERCEQEGAELVYEQLRREWNERYPEWVYRDRRVFWRALRNAVQDVYGIQLPTR